MNDLISRQAAIELIENESRKWGDEYGVSDVLCDLADLPAAQPEKRTNKSTKTHACDLIDRQALMKEFSDFVRASNNSDFAPTPTWNDAVSLVGSMPLAQQDLQPTCNQLATDSISRQAAIDLVEGLESARLKGEIDLLYPKVVKGLIGLPSAQPDDWMERNKERILQAGMEGREIEFRIGGRLFAIREKAQ